MDLNSRCRDFLKFLIKKHIIDNKEAINTETKIFAVTHGGYLTEFYNVYNSILGNNC